MTADRVAKLIALASSPNEHEARTAAYQACRIIRENGLVVLAADDPRLRGGGVPFAGVDLDDMLRDLRRRTDELRRETERKAEREREAHAQWMAEQHEAERKAKAAAQRQKRREAADPFKYNGTRGAPHARMPSDADIADAKQQRRRKRPERVILNELTRCNTCGHECSKGARVWRHDGKPGVTCGLCENGVA